jgi:membrane-associated protein
MSPHDLLDTFGPAALLLVMFAETGLLIGFFLPGDSLLFSAGVLSATSATGTLHVAYVPSLICAATGAVLGAQCGYLIGRRAGPTLLDDHRHPKLHESAGRAAVHLERYGVAKALVLGRFIPIVRTVVNPLAGALRVPVKLFTLWQVLGGLLWTISIVVLGHEVGNRISGIDKYVLPVVAGAVLISLVPVILEVRRSRALHGGRAG